MNREACSAEELQNASLIPTARLNRDMCLGMVGQCVQRRTPCISCICKPKLCAARRTMRRAIPHSRRYQRKPGEVPSSDPYLACTGVKPWQPFGLWKTMAPVPCSPAEMQQPGGSRATDRMPPGWCMHHPGGAPIYRIRKTQGGYRSQNLVRGPNPVTPSPGRRQRAVTLSLQGEGNQKVQPGDMGNRVDRRHG